MVENNKDKSEKGTEFYYDITPKFVLNWGSYHYSMPFNCSKRSWGFLNPSKFQTTIYLILLNASLTASFNPLVVLEAPEIASTSTVFALTIFAGNSLIAF